MNDQCPKCGLTDGMQRGENQCWECIMCDYGMDLEESHHFEARRMMKIVQRDQVEPLRRQLAQAIEQRDRLLSESDDFQCGVASALGWDCKGEPFVDIIKRHKAIIDKLKIIDIEAAEAFCEGCETGQPTQQQIEALLNAGGSIRRLLKEHGIEEHRIAAAEAALEKT